MSDLINRRDAIDAIRSQAIHTPEALNDIGISYYEGLHFAFQLISMLPSAEPKMGKWIRKGMSINCSVCKKCSWSFSFEDTVRRFNYCPHCGAKMEVE